MRYHAKRLDALYASILAKFIFFLAFEKLGMFEQTPAQNSVEER
jgi:hypothetical protein